MSIYDGDAAEFLRCYEWSGLDRGHGICLFRSPGSVRYEHSCFYIRCDSRGHYLLSWHIYNEYTCKTCTVASVQLQLDELPHYDPRTLTDRGIRGRVYSRLQDILLDTRRNCKTGRGLDRCDWYLQELNYLKNRNAA